MGINVDRVAIKTTAKNAAQTGLSGRVQWVNGDINAIAGKFDTVVQNPPFGVQTREADRAFLVKALEVANAVYSLHNHPEVDRQLIAKLKAGSGFLQVERSPFLARFIERHGGTVLAVYAMLMTIPKMFEFHTKARHDFVVDLYFIERLK